MLLCIQLHHLGLQLNKSRLESAGESEIGCLGWFRTLKRWIC